MSVPENLAIPQNYMEWLHEALSVFSDNPNHQRDRVSQLMRGALQTSTDTSAFSTSSYHEGDWKNNSFSEFYNYNQQNPKYAGLLASMLNIASQAIFLGNHNKAAEILQHLKEILKMIPETHQFLIKVSKYFYASLTSFVFKTGEVVTKIDEISQMWAEFKTSRKHQAVVIFLKENLTREILGDIYEKQYSEALETVSFLRNYWFLANKLSFYNNYFRWWRWIQIIQCGTTTHTTVHETSAVFSINMCKVLWLRAVQKLNLAPKLTK